MQREGGMQFLRRLLNGFLAVYYLITSHKLFAPHIKQNPKNAQFINKVCGDSFVQLVWNLFAGAFESDTGISASHVQPALGNLNEGDPFPRETTLIPVTYPDKLISLSSAKPTTFGAIIDAFKGLPAVLNFGSLT